MTSSLLKKVPAGVIRQGSKLTFSVFNKAGKLLLSEGRVISSVKQSRFIEGQGYFKEALIHSAAIDDGFSPENDNNTLMELINSWIKTLLVLRANIHEPKVNFSHLVLEVALNIQLQCKRDLNSILTAMQLKVNKDYNIINAIHSAVICEIIAKQCGLTQAQRLPIIAGAITHDIGFEQLQNKLQSQRGKLSQDQLDAVEQHPVISELILRKQGVEDSVWLDVVRHHHERLDGSGYPDRLAGEELSLAVRIMAIADTYVAMSHSTVYRPDSSSTKAIRTIYKNKKGFDEKLIYPFIDSMGVYPLGSIVRLHNKEIALVTNLNKTISCPIVTVLQNSKLFIKNEVIVRDTADEQYKVISTESLDKYPYLQPQIRQLLL